MPKLSHTSLINIGKALGYSSFDGGVCHGFSLMWLQAILANDEKTFYRRLHYLAKFNKQPNFLKKIISDIKIKVKNKLPLGKEEQLTLSFLSFFDGIALYLHPRRYTSFFNKLDITQQHLREIYSIVKPAIDLNTELQTYLNKPYAFTQDSMSKYFNDLEMILKTSTIAIPILLISSSHTVCLKYNPTYQNWEYIDTNNFEKYPSQRSYYQKLNTSELITSIYESFETKHPHHALFTTQIMTLDKDPLIQSKFIEFNRRYPIMPSHLDMKSTDQTNLLLLSGSNNHFLTTKIIMKHPIDLDQRLNNGFSIVHLAVQNYAHRMLKLLFKHKANANQLSQAKISPLHVACYVGNFLAVQQLIKNNANIDQKTAEGATPVYMACSCNQLLILKELISHKANLNRTTKLRATPLLIASYYGHLEIVLELLKHNINVNQKAITGETALYVACGRGHISIVQALLHHGAKLQLRINCGQNALDIACINHHTDVVKLLLENLRAKNQFSIHIVTRALYIICATSQPNQTQALYAFLVEQGANLLSKNKKGHTILDIALMQGNSTAIQVILEHCIKQKILSFTIMSDASFKAATHWAKKNDRKDILSYLSNKPLHPLSCQSSLFFRPPSKHCLSFPLRREIVHKLSAMPYS